VHVGIDHEAHVAEHVPTLGLGADTGAATGRISCAHLIVLSLVGGGKDVEHLLNQSIERTEEQERLECAYEFRSRIVKYLFRGKKEGEMITLETIERFKKPVPTSRANGLIADDGGGDDELDNDCSS
jgi:hypothetical protein